MKIVEVKLSWKSRIELFIIKYKVFGLRGISSKHLKDLFFPNKFYVRMA